MLRAYTAYNPKEGFCQAHAPIVSVLLMHMPEEPSFWCLVAMLGKYLPGYYSGQLVSSLPNFLFASFTNIAAI